MTEAVVRQTRFHETSNPPDALDKILNLIARDRSVRRKGYVPNKDHLRGLCARADGYYRDKGPADAVYRFLINAGVLVPSEDGLWFDDARSGLVLESVGAGTPPPSLAGTPSQERIEAIKARREKRHAAGLDFDDTSSGASSSAVPLPPPSSPDSEPDGEVRLCSDLYDGHRSYVLFLTPVEEEVWMRILHLSGTYDPSGTDLLKPKRKPLTSGERIRLEWDPAVSGKEEFLDACTRFVCAGILESIAGSEQMFYLHRHPCQYHAMRIVGGQRPVVIITQEQLDVIRAIQEGKFEIPHGSSLRNALTDWLTAFKPGLNVKSMLTRLCSYTPQHVRGGWGVLLKPTEDGDWLMSVRDFESRDFQIAKAVPALIPEVEPSDSDERVVDPIAAEFFSDALASSAMPESSIVFHTKQSLGLLSDGELHAAGRDMRALEARVVEQLNLISAESDRRDQEAERHRIDEELVAVANEQKLLDEEAQTLAQRQAEAAQRAQELKARRQKL